MGLKERTRSDDGAKWVMHVLSICEALGSIHNTPPTPKYGTAYLATLL